MVGTPLTLRPPPSRCSENRCVAEKSLGIEGFRDLAIDLQDIPLLRGNARTFGARIPYETVDGFLFFSVLKWYLLAIIEFAANLRFSS
jgi:hypothetical protein